MRRIAWLALALLLSGFGAQGATPALPLKVSGAWALPGKAGTALGFVYMTISLAHESDDTLIGASTSLTRKVEIMVPASGAHEAVRSLPVDGKAPLVMQVHGAHIILRGLRQYLKIGQSFDLTLHFAKAGDIAVVVPVLAHAPEYGMPGLPQGFKLN